MTKTRQALLALAIGIFAASAYLLGRVTASPVISPAERAYELSQVVGETLGRTKLIVDEMILRSLDKSQCVSPQAMAALSKWADKCVIANCSVDLGDGRPFVGIQTTGTPVDLKPTKAKP